MALSQVVRDAAETGAHPHIAVDVLVVGAGPSGCVVATLLARAGMNVVLLEKVARADSNSAHDVLVGAAGCELLGDHFQGALSGRLRSFEQLKVCFGEGRSRVFDDNPSWTFSDATLRERLKESATRAGASFVNEHLLSLEQVSDGWHAMAPDPLVARHLIWAAGAERPARLQKGLESHHVGLFGAQRLVGVGGPVNHVTLTLKPPSLSAASAPVSVWALPGESGHGTLGVACVGGDADRPLASLFQLGLEAVSEDPCYADAALVGDPHVGPLDAGFSAERVKRGPGIVIGDAAGLVNPFNGDGLSFALESAYLAYSTIRSNHADPQMAQRAYARRATAAFVGYFETARHASRRYHLMWRTLSASAEVDSPFIEKGRRAVLLPTGLSGVTLPEAKGCTGRAALSVKPFLLACDEVLLSTIRKEWPFLARATTRGGGTSSDRSRPATLFAASALAGGQPLDPALANVAAAIELAWLGSLAFIDTQAGSRPRINGIDWAMTASVVGGDFLLAQASRIIAESHSTLSWSFSEWLLALVGSRLKSRDPGADPATFFATLFDFPARIGAMLGGADEQSSDQARKVGLACGSVFQRTEEVLAIAGRRTRLDMSFGAMQRAGLTAATNEGSASDRLIRAVHSCRIAERHALELVAGIKVGTAAELMRTMILTLAEPCRDVQ